MALIKPTLLGPASGKLAGAVFSHNRSGQYLRRLVTPVNRRTDAQITARANLTSGGAAWRALDEEERASWNAYAANVPVINRVGDSVHLTGSQWYSGMFSKMSAAGLSPVTMAPTTFDRGSLGVFSITMDDSLTGSVDFDPLADWNAANGALYCQFGRPQNGTVNFFNGPWAQAGAIVVSTPLTSPNPLTIYDLTPVVAGQAFFARLTGIAPDGRYTNPQVYRCVVTEA